MHHEYVNANICSMENKLYDSVWCLASLLKKISRRLMTLSFTIHLEHKLIRAHALIPLHKPNSAVSCIFSFLSQIIQFEDHSIFLADACLGSWKVPPNNVHSFLHPIFSTMKYVFEPLN
ncbi:hypothetical protein ACJX0J_011277 [Zea mays]